MARTGDHSTYQHIIDMVMADMPNTERLSELPKSTLVLWILRAEQEICSSMHIRDEYPLILRSGFDVAKFVENPVITAVTSMRLTAASHGLTLGERIFLERMNGLVGMQGRHEVTAVDGNDFVVARYADISGATNASPIVVSTSIDHDFEVGNGVVISGVTGNTAANGAFIISAVTARTFTLSGSTGNGDYEDGGIAYMVPNVTGTYVGGGRFYRLTEIPTRIGFVRRLRFEDGSYIGSIDGEDEDVLLDGTIYDNNTYGSYTRFYPTEFSQYEQGGIRYLRVYPQPTADLNTQLYGMLQVQPARYATDDMNATIHLRPEYEPFIMQYVSAMLTTNMRDRVAQLNAFRTGMEFHKTQKPIMKRMRITYK